MTAGGRGRRRQREKETERRESRLRFTSKQLRKLPASLFIRRPLANKRDTLRWYLSIIAIELKEQRAERRGENEFARIAWTFNE